MAGQADAASRDATGAGLAERIEAAIGLRPRSLAPLGGGSIAQVHRARLPDGADVVVKQGDGLETEAYMLGYLAAHSRLPVPRVHYADPHLLVMDYIEAGDAIDARAELHAAEIMAALHAITAERFGHERDTLIAALPQPNPPTGSWLDFFRGQRLLYMGRLALDAGRIAAPLMARLERFAGRLERFIDGSARPALIHGDLWAGNILVRKGRVVGLVDPAIYYADPEIELAFATLFNSLGAAFFRRYGELMTLRPGFHAERRHIYNLYPLLVHARLFGGSYPAAIERTLARFGA